MGALLASRVSPRYERRMGRYGIGTANSGKHARGLVLAVATIGALLPQTAGQVLAQEMDACAKAEFESAVDEAAVALRDLNNKNRPEFQTRLRDLKEKRGWSDDEFLKEAAPFVQDEKIAVFDEESNKLLTAISTLGTEGASASIPDCAMLSELRRLMGVLIETQSSKWAYMFEKLDAELAR